MKFALLFLLLIGCDGELLLIRNTNYNYNTYTKDVCQVIDDVCIPVMGRILYSDCSCKKASVGKRIQDVSLPDDLAVKSIRDGEGNFYELGEIKYIQKGEKYYEKLEYGCVPTEFGMVDISYREVE